MKQEIGMIEKNLQEVGTILSNVMFDANLLFCRAKEIHRIIGRESIIALHKHLQSHYTKLADGIEKIAERTSKMGGYIPSTMVDFINLYGLHDTVGNVPKQSKRIKVLLAKYETIIKSLRMLVNGCDEEFATVATSDFLNAIMRGNKRLHGHCATIVLDC